MSRVKNYRHFRRQGGGTGRSDGGHPGGALVMGGDSGGDALTLRAHRECGCWNREQLAIVERHPGGLTYLHGGGWTYLHGPQLLHLLLQPPVLFCQGSEPSP
ncbi:hypothetical protein U1Q18_002118 [Sarracenia purpurea var. burkii]